MRVFVRKDIYIDISNNCQVKDLEICAVELENAASQSHYAYTEPPQQILIDLLKL